MSWYCCMSQSGFLFVSQWGGGGWVEKFGKKRHEGVTGGGEGFLRFCRHVIYGWSLRNWNVSLWKWFFGADDNSISWGCFLSTPTFFFHTLHQSLLSFQKCNRVCHRDFNLQITFTRKLEIILIACVLNLIKVDTQKEMSGHCPIPHHQLWGFYWSYKKKIG